MEEKIVRVEIIMDMKKLMPLIRKLNKSDITGVTVFQGVGCGIQKGSYEYEPETDNDIQLLPNSLVMIFCQESQVEKLVELVKQELYTGHIGDGKILISGIDNVIRVRTGEEGLAALKPSTVQ